MSRSIFVGNLPYSAGERDVSGLFGRCGQVVNVKIVRDRETGRPRGFGFCEFETDEGANVAVQSMDGVEFMGRTLRVDRANSR
ncbi:hypothetical protein AB6A40_010068 [Gnathostoma spinigerum]|uniref:RRM domain-containing protein n=1 Tax=Gnathostoma spinigerum TaxID=75299 RepID=A0ABD6F0T4_9BILA